MSKLLLMLAAAWPITPTATVDRPAAIRVKLAPANPVATSPAQPAERDQHANTTGTGSAPADADLSSLLTTAVGHARSALPIRSGPATIIAMEASGTTVVLTMEISAPVHHRWSSLDPGLRKNVCDGPFSRLIAQGASIRVDMTDSTGDRYSVTVDRC